ncbi:hypothetical protein GDO78_015776 [Eleutherodactylus coqui]|uniref:Secreted protein n=1 Tax=Eleutherodactylus coqui TaxID=57060 RepID=A0A8J6EDA3_ELECQ|nr:hypothetical protein GDO78_015776 [Eleutherodactylus coqui]
MRLRRVTAASVLRLFPCQAGLLATLQHKGIHVGEEGTTRGLECSWAVKTVKGPHSVAPTNQRVIAYPNYMPPPMRWG